MGSEHLPRSLKQKSKFLYVYDYHIQLFSIFQKKYPEVRFRLLLFFHSHFYLLNLFRLGCLFFGLSGIYSLSFIITRYEIRKTVLSSTSLVISFYKFVTLSPHPKKIVPQNKQNFNWKGKNLDINQCQTMVDKLTKRIEGKQQSQRFSLIWPVGLSIKTFTGT